MKAQPFLTLIFIHTPHPRHQKTLFYLQNTSRISPLLPTSTAAALFPTPGLPHLGPHGSCPPPRASMLLPLLPSTCSQHSSSSCDNVSQIMRLPCLTPPMTPSRAVSKQTPLDCHEWTPVTSRPLSSLLCSEHARHTLARGLCTSPSLCGCCSDKPMAASLTGFELCSTHLPTPSPAAPKHSRFIFPCSIFPAYIA